MFNSSDDIQNFHDEAVRLPESARKTLREARAANQTRLKKGLKEANEPAPLRFVQQGSYAMHTTVQHPKNDYDIDDGVLFSKKDLKGAQGSDKSALDARNMVCDALQDKTFKKKPEVHKHCVRIFYNEGHHVDIPVYRVVDPSSDDTEYELAGADWTISNPEGVTKWFEDSVKRHNGTEAEDPQMRRQVRLLKAFAISRDSWNMPSGFHLTVLTDELYKSHAKEDEGFYNLLSALQIRLKGSLVVNHPVVDETLTKTDKDANMVELADKVDWALEQLEVIRTSGCSKKAELKAWATVFNTDFFQDQLDKEASARAPFVITGSTPSRPVEKQGGGRFG